MMEVDSNIKSLGESPLLTPAAATSNQRNSGGVNASASLANLLTQTLQSGNENEITKVIRTCSHKAKVLETTVKKLPTNNINT